MGAGCPRTEAGPTVVGGRVVAGVEGPEAVHHVLHILIIRFRTRWHKSSLLTSSLSLSNVFCISLVRRPIVFCGNVFQDTGLRVSLGRQKAADRSVVQLTRIGGAGGLT